MMDIEKLARDAGLTADVVRDMPWLTITFLPQFAEAVRRETAEEAAKVAEQTGQIAADMYGDGAECLSTADLCAAAIRERFKAS